MPLLKTLSSDEAPSVKVLAIETYAEMAKLLKDGNNVSVSSSELVPLIKAATADFSWRARYAIAKDFDKFVKFIAGMP